MTKRSSLEIEWLLDRSASSDEVEAVTQIVLEEGLPGQVTATLFQKGLADDPWMIFILTPVALFLKAFLEEAGRTGYHDLRRLVSRLVAARRRGQGHVALWGKNSPTKMVFAPDLPEEAFKQLAELDLDHIEGKYWVWDREQRRWTHQSMDGE